VITSLRAALCFRSLVTGVPYARQNTVEARWVDVPRMRAGIEEVRASGNLHGKPAIILHGRSDPLLPPNHTSRAYFGLNKIVEGERSRLSYVEVVNGNHFDSFIPLFGGVIPIFGVNTLIPMHYYFEQALSLMRDHLLGKAGTTLPPSQVLVGSVANKPWDTLAKVRLDMPDLASSPPPNVSITFSNGILSIP
jgi:hydroxybutyrate-dimer hydrolase